MIMTQATALTCHVHVTDQTHSFAKCSRGDLVMPDTDQSTLTLVMAITACPV